MKILFVLISFCALFTGCGNSPASEVVIKYLQADIQERPSFVLHPEQTVPIMTKVYNQNKTQPASASNLKKATFTELSDKEKPAFIPASYTVVVGQHPEFPDEPLSFFLKQNNGSWKIDWEATYPYNEMNLIEFRNKQPKKSTVFRANAKVDSYYNYEFGSKQSEYYSIRLDMPRATSQEDYVFGYIKKNIADGEAIFNFLKNGDVLPVTITLLPARGNDVAYIDKFISKGWIN